MNDRDEAQTIADLAELVAGKFTESDWKQLAQRIGFRDKVNRHPRLLRSLSWNDEDYPGHVLDMINAMVAADPANLEVIRAKALGDETAFFERQPARFRRGELLGEGGYGQVYREHDELLDIDFARKELAPSNFVDDEVIGRFLREARLLFRLSHPNIISVYDVGRLGRSAFIRMELFQGQKLNELGQLTPLQARQHVLRLSAGLAHAHSRGVIHRDLKPSNVMVSGQELRIIDFGLGAFIDADLDTRLTRSDESVAGGSFCAPELKESSRVRDPRCDVYSVGALWFFMVTGRDPTGSDLAVRLGAVGDIPRDEQEFILRCMAIADRRPRDGGQLLAEVRSLAAITTDKRTDPAAANELTDYESSCMAAFACAFPEHGSSVRSDILRRHGDSIGFTNDLRWGAALLRLESKGYVSQSKGEDYTWWDLTDTGRNWLASNADYVLAMQEPRRGKAT